MCFMGSAVLTPKLSFGGGFVSYYQIFSSKIALFLLLFSIKCLFGGVCFLEEVGRFQLLRVVR